MPSGWLSGVVVAVVIGSSGGCKAARDYAEKKYEERRAPEIAAERSAEERAAQEEAERPPTPRPGGSGLDAGKYFLRAVKVDVFATNRRGNAWDDPPDTTPDLGIEVKVDGKRVASCKRPEVTAAECTFEDVEIELGATSSIVVEVVDKDTLVDDPIGTAMLEDPSAWGGDIEMSMVPRSRIRSAAVVLGLPPSWWDKYGRYAIGLGVGAIAIFGAMYFLGTRRKSSKTAAKSARTCSACGARLANYAKCSDCGAEQQTDDAVS